MNFKYYSFDEPKNIKEHLKELLGQYADNCQDFGLETEEQKKIQT
jgi:hypothetical protein